MGMICSIPGLWDCVAIMISEGFPTGQTVGFRSFRMQSFSLRINGLHRKGILSWC